MIILEGARKTWPGGRGLHETSLSLGPGIHGIVGPNGAGKTTFLKLVMGLVRPDAGRVLVDGADIWAEAADGEWRKSVGYFPAEDYFYGFLSGRKNLEYLSLLRTGSREALPLLEDALRDLELLDVLDEPFSTCSTGTRKKLQLAASLLGDPPVLVWDEPNNGVDLVSNIRLRARLEALRAAGGTVVLSSHVIEFMDGLLDSLTVLNGGRTVLHAAPAPSDLRTAFLAALAG